MIELAGAQTGQQLPLGIHQLLYGFLLLGQPRPLFLLLIAVLAAVTQTVGYALCCDVPAGPCSPEAAGERGKYFFRILVSNISSAMSMTLFKISFSASKRSICFCSSLILRCGVGFPFMGWDLSQFKRPCFLNQTKTVLRPWMPYLCWACR